MNNYDHTLKRASASLAALLHGCIPEELPVDSNSEPSIAQLVHVVNNMIASMAEVHDFIIPLSKGELNSELPSRRNLLASPFKELHSRLKHLTWQAAHVAEGDYSQRIEFMGDFSQSFNSMIEQLQQREETIKRNLAELDQARQQLEEEKNRFRTVADFTYDWELWIAEDNSILYISPSSERVSGYPPEAFLEDNALLADLVHPADRPLYEEHHRKMHQSEEVLSCEFRIVTRDGSSRWIAHLSQPVSDTGGKRHGWRITNRDITQQKKAEETLARRQEQLIEEVGFRKRAELAHDEARQAAEAANSAKSQFLANMSHEIRTPMTAIVGYVDLLSDHVGSDDSLFPKEVSQNIGSIRHNCSHLLTIINHILDISRVDSGNMPLERSNFSPSKALSKAIALTERQALEKGLNLKVIETSNIPESINSDPTRLRQILVGLIGNAIKFTCTGDILITIGMASPTDEGNRPQLAFEVSDPGVGITPPEMENIFQAFTQADETMTRRYGGTGLGLTLSKALVSMLGGELTVESVPGEGSTFRFTIETGPLDGTRMIGYHEGACLGHYEEKRTARIQLSASILVCEDSPDIQKLVAAILTKAGATVAVADNGMSGYAKALASQDAGVPYDLILMDMQMPLMDGYEAARSLREEGYNGPIIALTAHAMASDRKKCLDAGCNDYATKPIDREALLSMLTGYLSPVASEKPG